ncbi:MAG: hypothetical protein AB1798_01680 [Spirochaetota bacterium]
MQTDDVQKFWSDLENTIGEKILIYSMGDYLGGYQNITGPVVGLFYLTATKLFFQTFPKENFLSTLFRGFTRSTTRNEPITFSIPLDKIKAVIHPPKKSFWKSFLSPAVQPNALDYLDDNETAKQFRFTLIAKEKEFLDILQEIHA